MVDDYCARRARSEQSAQNYCIVIDVSSSPLFIVVSGPPASGKTSLAAPLSQALGVALISKDAIKERLFEAVGYGGSAWSRTLSRAADTAMMRIARDLDGAVLDSFWYAETVDELLTPLPRPIVEVLVAAMPKWPMKGSEAGFGTLGMVTRSATRFRLGLPSARAQRSCRCGR
jgi:AAA domain